MLLGHLSDSWTALNLSAAASSLTWPYSCPTGLSLQELLISAAELKGLLPACVCLPPRHAKRLLKTDLMTAVLDYRLGSSFPHLIILFLDMVSCGRELNPHLILRK